MNNQALALVQELIKGPNGEGIKTIPPSTQLRGLTVKNGIAYVDFSPEIARNHPGGSTAELLTIYSIVDSLILNFPEIKKVQLLIDGHEIDTLAGHVNCRHPLIARKDLIAQEK
jgi:spore germination protein GerM